MEGKVYKVFTVSHGRVEEGAQVDELELKGAGVKIPAVIIGEDGRNRFRGVLPVVGAEPDSRVLAGSLGKTKAGNPKLFSRPIGEATSDEVLVVLRTGFGYRGSNEHTGDRAGWKCNGCFVTGEGPTPNHCPECGREWCYSGPSDRFLEFPGTILVKGKCAEGIAGRVSQGDQYIALIPRGAVFRTAYTGRLYGEPEAHYYIWTGEKLLSATKEERELSDLF